jgi:hypothetical protein
MNPWPFVIAAYALTFVGTAGLCIISWRTMTGAEKRADMLARGASHRGDGRRDDGRRDDGR